MCYKNHLIIFLDLLKLFHYFSSENNNKNAITLLTRHHENILWQQQCREVHCLTILYVLQCVLHDMHMWRTHVFYYCMCMRSICFYYVDSYRELKELFITIVFAFDILSLSCHIRTPLKYTKIEENYFLVILFLLSCTSLIFLTFVVIVVHCIFSSCLNLSDYIHSTGHW